MNGNRIAFVPFVVEDMFFHDKGHEKARRGEKENKHAGHISETV
jgi:hypothetical protein